MSKPLAILASATRRLSGVLLLCLWLANAALADTATADFTDLQKSHWAYTAISEMVDQYHILSGFPDKTYQGSRNLSRYEFAAALTKVLAVIEREKGVDLKATPTAPHAFKDVPASLWATPAVNSIANDYALIEGFPDGTYQGTRNTSRYEVAALLYKLGQRLEERIGPYTGEIGTDFAKFTDVPASHWAAPAIKAVVDKYGILQGFPDHTFKGARFLTRYEFAALLSRLIKFALALEKPPPPTVAPTPVPTPVPTPEPIFIKPLPLMRMIDIQGNFFGGASSSFGSSYSSMFGAFGQATGWLPSNWARLGPGHFGLSGYAAVTYGQATTYVLTGVISPTNNIAAGVLAPVNYYQYNVLAGLQAKYRLDLSKAWGTTPEEADTNPSVTFGVGYGMAYINNPIMPYLGHGVSASLAGEYPVAWSIGSTTIGLYADLGYSYLFPDQQKNYNYLNGRLPATMSYGGGIEFGGFNWDTGEITFRAGYQGYTIFQDVLGNGNRMFQMNGGHVGVRLRI